MWMATLTYASALILVVQGFYLMYRSTKVPNFAIGAISTIGAYSAYTCKDVFGLHLNLGYPIAFMVGAVLTLFISVLIIEPLIKRGRSVVEITLATIGLGILFEALIQMFVYLLRTILDRYYSSVMLYHYIYKDYGVDSAFLVSTFLAFSSFLLLRHVFLKTRFGLSNKAAWENLSLAQVQGVNPVKDRICLWMVAGGLSGLAGGVMVMRFHVTPIMGSWMMIAVFASVILGGMDSHRGAFIGSLVIGFVEILGTSWAQRMIGVWFGEYRSILTIFLMVIGLLINPNGLFGKEIPANQVRWGFINRFSRKQWITIISIFLLSGCIFTYICTVNRVKARDTVLQEFSDYDLEVMNMNRSLTSFFAGNITSFKNMINRLNVTKVYVEPYTEKSSELRFFFLRNNIYWKIDVKLEYYGICQYQAR